MQNITNPSPKIKPVERCYIGLDGRRRIYCPRLGDRLATGSGVLVNQVPRFQIGGFRDDE